MKLSAGFYRSTRPSTSTRFLAFGWPQNGSRIRSSWRSAKERLAKEIEAAKKLAEATRRMAEERRCKAEEDDSDYSHGKYDQHGRGKDIADEEESEARKILQNVIRSAQ